MSQSQEFEVVADNAPAIIGARGMDDVMQCIRYIVRTTVFSVPLDRGFAQDGSYIDAPMPHAVATRMSYLISMQNAAIDLAGRQNLLNTVSNYHIDPLAQTFTPERNIQLCGADIFFTAKSGQVRIQIRDVRDGVPTATILAEAVLEPDRIVASGGGHTRAFFDVPVQVQAGQEYALVILCNDPDTAVTVADTSPQMPAFPATFQAVIVKILLRKRRENMLPPLQKASMILRDISF